MAPVHVWLRAELALSAPSRGNANAPLETERRTVLSPGDARKLLASGFRVTVERSNTRIFADADYEAAGCELVPSGAWLNAPRDAVVLGLRVPASTPALDRAGLQHRHVYFGHVFKHQLGWQEVIARFARGGGQLWDLEYLTDEAGHRLVSFGPIAGTMGVAAGLLAWCRQVLATLGIVMPHDLVAKLAHLPLIDYINGLLQTASASAGRMPRLIIIGAGGRVGRGAAAFADQLGLTPTLWTRANTNKAPGPFAELLQYDVLINAIKLGDEQTSPFLSHELIRSSGRRLSVLVDISCDVASPNNPLPIYSQTTTFGSPSVRVMEEAAGVLPLDVIAIPTLPSLLPELASRNFSEQLLPHLLTLPFADSPVWSRAAAMFEERARLFRPAAVTSLTEPAHVPLSPAQRRIMQLSELGQPADDPAAYQLSKAYVVAAGVLEAAVLERSLHALLDAEPLLRTSFPPPAAAGATRVATIAAAGSAGAVQLLQLEPHLSPAAVLHRELCTPFDVARYPLLRVTLVGPAADAAADAGQRVLVVSAHELIADAASLDLLVHRLVQAATTGAVPPAGGLVHADIARWQQQQQAASSVGGVPTVEAGRLDYWRTQLAGNCHCLQLPLDRPRPPQQTFTTASHAVDLPPPVVASLRQLSVRLGWSDDERLSLTALLLAAFKLLLMRYTGEQDIIVGTQVSGRWRAEMAAVAGPLANTLLLRTNLSDDLDFASLFQRVGQTLGDALAHSEVPFEAVLDAVLPADQPHGHVPLSQLRFVSSALLAAPPAAAANSLVSAASEQPDAASAYDWTMRVDETADGAASVRLSYNSQLFGAARIVDTLQQLRLLLDQLLVNPAQNVLGYRLVTQRASTAVPDPRQPLDAGWPGPLPHVFSANAAKHPERLAIAFEDERISYGHLELLTNRLANSLMASGIKPQDVIGLYGHRSPAVVWAIVGILKAGAAYTMMDPAYPVSRIVTCLDIAKPRGWIAIGAAGDIPSELDTYLSSLGLLCRLVLPPLSSPEASALLPSGGDQDALPALDIGQEHTAVVTFTSGSTGIPKGVMGRHGPLTHFYPWMSQRFGLNADDRFSMCSGIAHDPLQRDIFTPLFFGAAVYIPSQDDIVTPGRLAEWMAAQSVSVSCLTPAMGQLLTTAVDVSPLRIPLRAAFFVGDMLAKRDVLRLRKLAPSVACINMYGSTETQRAVGYFEVPADPDVLGSMKEVIPCGYGMRDVQLLVINNAGLLCGVGELGEIYVRSPHLAKGYMGLDGGKFVVNPFTSQPADRMYRTGDLGRYMADGVAECIGRADDQVKIRGFRIELGEINATLSKHPAVKENVTVVRDERGDKQLVSYIVPTALDAAGHPLATGAAVDSGELGGQLRDFLKRQLPHYMVPGYVVVIHAMPLTPNGKINRQALPAPDAAVERARHGPSVLPLSDTEQQLMQIWARVLGREVNSVEDNFFDLGGHSLLATRLAFELNTALCLPSPLPLALVFSAPTVAALATAVDRLRAPGVGASLAPTSTLDLEKEVQLDEAVSALGLPLPASPHPGALRRVLLTGATGFLGAFLLHDLLQHTDAVVHCVVRAASPAEGEQRLHKSLRVCRLWRDDFAPRIVVEVGDLGQRRLGMPEADWLRLADSTDAIVHNGAFVHWLLPYEKLKATNVGSTQEVLRLATTARLKPVHLVSTTSVYDDAVHRQQEAVLESDPLASSVGLSGGYPQSKWVADRIALLARQRGVPVNIYRPGFISGDSSHGVWNTDDFLCRLIKGCVQLSCAPDIEDPRAMLDMCPVDYVSGVIVSTLKQPQLINMSFNIVNPNPVRYNRLFTQAASFGYAIDIVPYAQWRPVLQQVSRSGGDNALSAVLAHFSDGWPSGLANPRYDCTNTLAAIAGSKLPLPEFDSLLVTYLSYLVSASFLPPPPSAASDRLHIDWQRIGDGVEMLSRTKRS
eukprot:TRINITY_DN1439_c0_g1_i1.p1 TRINITY_DN1439_c0_g1~~TRINITY_DN1439_c0_g1_i1.p1  ORF type:complete len:1931 (+),score=838.25 TRINITY_DN1439_c0_g1_i1:91-5883(+)